MRSERMPQGSAAFAPAQSAAARRASAMLVATAIVLCLAACSDRTSYQPPPPPLVTVQHPARMVVTLHAEFTGSTAAANKADLVARVSGFLEDVRFRDGDKVKKGQSLFLIEQAPYQTTLQAAQAVQAQQQALLAQAEADLARQTTLVQRQAASAASVDEARTKRDSTSAALDQARAQVRQAEINLAYTDVKAPFDGVMAARLVDPGSFVGSGGTTRLGAIVATDPVHVNFNINEQQALQVRQALRDKGRSVGDIGPVPVDVGLQTETGFPHHGVIDYVAPTVDLNTGTQAVRAVLENRDGAFQPGLFVRVRVPTRIDAAVLAIPESALAINQQGRYVLTVDDKSIVAERQVQVGDAIPGGLRIITSGLNESDNIIVVGLQRATPGAAVSTQAQADASQGAR